MSIYDDEKWQEAFDDYRPPHVRHADRVIELFRDMPVDEPLVITPPPFDPIEEIARLVRSLTYEQMLELASGLGRAPQDIHRWAQAIRGP